MSVAPNAGVVDLDTFLPPSGGQDGLQGQVPKPLAGQEDYVLTASGWVPLSSLGTLIYQGTWDASTNTPTLTSSVGTNGYYYVVSVSGNTDLNGITTWTVGDWALFNGSVWQKIEGGSTVDITGGQINNTVIGNNVPAAGTFTTLTPSSVVAASTSLNIATSDGITNFQVKNDTTSGTAGFVYVIGASASLGRMALRSSKAFYVSSGSSNPLALQTGSGVTTEGTTQLNISHTSSAVNYVQVTGAATTTFPIISSQGSDSAVSLGLTAKGGNAIIFFTNSGSNRGLRVSHTASSVNYVDVSAGATGSVPVIGNAGSDSNIGLALKTTGTGAIDLAAGSSGVNISNGGTVTGLTRTSSGGSYTSIPSIAISAPTTAGGVQATANANVFVQAVALVSGGTGYTVGDTLTLVGGTFTTASTLTVSTVSAGVITGVTVASGGTAYTVMPTNPISVTGGTGSGATFNATAWGVAPTFTITNAGSGYVEQPTVTFSGGGGSGAAAYATVGGTTTFKTVGGVNLFNTPGGTQFSIADNFGATTTSWWGAQGSTTVADFRTQGGGVTAGAFTTQTAVPLLFRTNFTEQLRVAHTASAVNYVQVTGAATGGSVVISAQGSDTNINTEIQSKATGVIRLAPAGTSRLTVQNNNGQVDLSITSAIPALRTVVTSSQVNYTQIAGAAVGTSPVVSAQGSDTNIDLALTPKGTGRVKFGTFTANMALTTQGYIEIVDSGGTVRKLAVIA